MSFRLKLISEAKPQPDFHGLMVQLRLGLGLGLGLGLHTHILTRHCRTHHHQRHVMTAVSLARSGGRGSCGSVGAVPVDTKLGAMLCHACE
jgi:hypothetical protein